MLPVLSSTHCSCKGISQWLLTGLLCRQLWYPCWCLHLHNGLVLLRICTNSCCIDDVSLEFEWWSCKFTFEYYSCCFDSCFQSSVMFLLDRAKDKNIIHLTHRIFSTDHQFLEILWCARDSTGEFVKEESALESDGSGQQSRLFCQWDLPKSQVRVQFTEHFGPG